MAKKIKRGKKRVVKKPLVVMEVVHKTCKKCGETNPIDNNFCKTCGHKFKKRCPFCLAIIHAKAHGNKEYCPNCGALLHIRCIKCGKVNGPEAMFCVACSREL